MMIWVALLLYKSLEFFDTFDIWLSNFWLEYCMYGKQQEQSDGFYIDLDIHHVDDISCFSANASSQFPQTLDRRFFSIELIAIEYQQQVGNQSCQQLE